MQLDSLLRSIDDHCIGIDNVVVAWRATAPLHQQAYAQAIKSAALACELHFVAETRRPLGTTLQSALRGDYDLVGASGVYAASGAPPDHVGFAVDDMLFYGASNFAQATAILDARSAFVWSWRRGLATRPDSVRAGIDFWLGPAGYAWHVDGSLYRTMDYMRMLDQFYPAWKSARTPNELEGVVAANSEEWSSGLVHVGPIEPTCMTWQINQAHETPSIQRAPFAAVPATELDVLAEAYLAGRRVDNKKLYADTSWTTKFQKRQGLAHVEACEEAAVFYASLIR